MKEVIAVIRPGKWPATKKRLMAMGLCYTQYRVHGRGKQKGLKYPSRTRNSVESESGIQLVPKRWLMTVVPDEKVVEAVQAIIEVNRTGSIGDGKIFVSPAETAVRLRTGETGSLALV